MDIILSHKQLDFDALASMVAAQKLYPNSVLVMDGKANSYVQEFLALSKDQLPLLRAQDINLEDIKRLILVDTHDVRRAGGIGENIARRTDLPIHIYDHHPFSGPSQEGMWIEPVGACATLLVEKIIERGIILSPFEATLIAIGIYDDTGSLLFENTTVRDVRAVAYLLEHGAQLGVVAKYLRKPLTEEQRELLQQILDHGENEFFDGIPVYLSYAECSDYVGGLALIAHRVGELEGAETWFLLVKMENRLYLVGRSRSKGLPVDQIVRAFGGSGHTRAASATIKNGDFYAVLEKLRQEIKNRVKKPFLVRDIMSTPVKTVSPDTTMADVEQILLRYGHTGVPVVADQRLVGIISRRDVQKAMKHGLKHAPVKGFMTTNVITVDADAGWDEVQRLMVQHDIGRLPVIEDNRLVGIVSRSDVLRLIHGGAVPIEEQLLRERGLALRQDILNLIESLPEGIRKLLKIIGHLADAEERSVYLVGGFVRDLLLLIPNQDLDIVVEGSGPEFASRLLKYLPQGELKLHSQFGTARIEFPDGTHLDIASTRWEYYEFPGALPQVEISSLRDDLFRRDFTINAMAISLNSNRCGELVDFYGGLRDLQQGTIRILHQLSFIDDPTRIVRAIRFAGRYGFRLAKETEEGIKTALVQDILNRLSIERFTHELKLVYQEKNYLNIGNMLVQYGVLGAWFKQELPWNFDQTLTLERKNWTIEMRWLDSLARMNSSEIGVVLERVRLTKELREVTVEYMRLREHLKGTPVSLSNVDRLLARKPEWFLTVLAQDDELKQTIEKYRCALHRMDMVTDGRKLQQLGIKEGPEIGRILASIRDAWLNGHIKSRLEEEEFVLNLVGKIC